MDNTRAAYLKQLADDFGLPLETVLTMAELLGPDEDHDALITMLDDMSMSDEYI